MKKGSIYSKRLNKSLNMHTFSLCSVGLFLNVGRSCSILLVVAVITQQFKCKQRVIIRTTAQ